KGEARLRSLAFRSGARAVVLAGRRDAVAFLGGGHLVATGLVVGGGRLSGTRGEGRGGECERARIHRRDSEGDATSRPRNATTTVASSSAARVQVTHRSEIFFRRAVT